MIINTDLIYPVGSIYLSVNATNPSKYFGGTWEQITGDAYLKIVSNSLDADKFNGTSSDHKIPITSMPSHQHSIRHGYNVTGFATPYQTPFNGWGMVGNGGTLRTDMMTNVGGSQPYYPYYYGICVWKRVA